MALKDSFKLRTTSQLEAEKKRIAEENRRQKWLKIENARTKREAYEIKEISGWMYTGPFLGMVVAAIAGFMLWAGGNTPDNQWLWWIIGIGIAPIILFGVASDLDTEWKASVAAKQEIDTEKGSGASPKDFASPSYTHNSNWLNGHWYKYDRIYTDSTTYYWLYSISKFIAGFSTIAFAILAAVLAFIWLGSITIAPSTIIIILLILILFKMK